MNLPATTGKCGNAQALFHGLLVFISTLLAVCFSCLGFWLWSLLFCRENKHPSIAHALHSQTPPPWKPNEKVVRVKYSSLIFIASPTASSHVCSIIRWGSCLQPISQGAVVFIIKVTTTVGSSDGGEALNKTARPPFITSSLGSLRGFTPSPMVGHKIKRWTENANPITWHQYSAGKMFYICGL